MSDTAAVDEFPAPAPEPEPKPVDEFPTVNDPPVKDVDPDETREEAKAEAEAAAKARAEAEAAAEQAAKDVQEADEAARQASDKGVVADRAATIEAEAAAEAQAKDERDAGVFAPPTEYTVVSDIPLSSIVHPSLKGKRIETFPNPARARWDAGWRPGDDEDNWNEEGDPA